MLSCSAQGMSHQPSVEIFFHLLHTCRLEGNQASALKMQACICDYGLDVSTWLGNHVVSMLAEVGSLHIASNALARLLHRTVSSWNSVIAGFVKLGNSQQALTLYKGMREDSLHPNGHTYVALLRACTALKDVNRGCVLHEEISKQTLLESDPYVNSALVHMYATFGLLVKAQEVFDKLPCQHAVAWNSLIAGYAKHERGNRALFCFNQMRQKGVTPTAITFVSSLKACGTIGDMDKGRELHAETARQCLLDSNMIVQSALVDMYIKCGALAIAQEVFDKLSLRNIITWTTLIAGYTKHEYGREALNCFEQMQLEGISPNAVTYACSLKACGIIGAIDKGNEIYAEISEKGLWKTELVVGNALVDMYIKCGLLNRAQEVFDELPFRDVVSWNAMMTGYSKEELFEEVLDSFEQMTREDVSPDAVTYIFCMKACGSIGVIDKGRDMHGEVVRQGLVERDPMVGNAVLDMYAKYGLLKSTQEVFDQLVDRDVVSWTVLIAGYAGRNRGKEALKCHEQMHVEGLFPNPITFVSILKACGSAKDEDKGRRLHARIAANVSLESDPAVRSALIEMYAKCGSLSKAKEVFDTSPAHNQILWNTMLSSYTQNDHCEEALQFFDMMTLNGLPADKITFLSCLKACGVVGAPDQGREFHAGMAANGWLSEKDNILGNVLVDMYAKCGLFVNAQQVIDKLEVQDTVSWTALMAGYVNHNDSKGALTCFEQMLLEGLFPNAATFSLGLKACGSIGALGTGQDMHSEIARKGLLERDLKVSSSLIGMYARCGQLAKAQEVFGEFGSQSVALWNALISGYAKHDQGEKAVICFNEMQHEGVSPDSVTFLSLINACNRAGLVDESHKYFGSMSYGYGICPTQEHHRCMADLLARSGDFDGARAFSMPPGWNRVVFRSTLNACQNLGNIKLGRAIFEMGVG